jgi:Fic family protein
LDPKSQLNAGVALQSRSSVKLTWHRAANAKQIPDILGIMDFDALSASPLGSVVPISGTDPYTGRDFEHYAYVPASLPAEIALRSSTWKQIVTAEAALGRLDQAAQQFPEPALLRRPAIRREAQSTSALEGTYAAFETVLASEPDDRVVASLEVREVLNYVVAAEEGFRWVVDRPITVGLIERLQQLLVANTPSERHDAGKIRTKQVFIGSRGTPIEESRFVPPPPGVPLRAAVADSLAWVRNPPEDLSPVVRAAVAHYQFETIHPFFDGNGRIGRLLIAMSLMADGVLREPILVVSPWFEARRDAYQDGLLNLSLSGNWDEWIRFFATGVADAADTTRSRVERLLAWREGALERVRAAGVSGVAERVAGDLIGSPIVRAPTVARQHHITPQGAMLALRRLVELGVLDEERMGGRIIFVANEAFDLLRV